MLIIEPPPDPHLVLQTIVDLKVSHVLFFLDICLDAKKHKYYSGYQFSIFDWPCERDKAEGTVRKNKLIGIVIGNNSRKAQPPQRDWSFRATKSPHE